MAEQGQGSGESGGRAQGRAVTRAEWLEARKAVLAQEKLLTRMRDEVTRARRALPWVRVDAPYTFQGPDGEETLEQLFAGRSQLIVYHFMFDPSWDEGCRSCSFLSDHYDGAVVHLAQRDVTMVAVSRAPLEKLRAFRARMGWRFKWVSSFGTRFNHDFQVTFTDDDRARGEIDYNYGKARFFSPEAPGLSVFARDERGVFHTYSTYARGLDRFITAYHLLDVVPRGRDEDGLGYSMAWLKLHDAY